MTINVGEVEAYGIMIERLQRQAGSEARRRVAQWVSSNTPWDVADLRAVSASVVGAVVSDYGASTSSLACDLYDSCMVSEGVNVPFAEPWDGDFSRQILKAVRYQIQNALEGDINAFLDAIDQMTQYYVRQMANRTTMSNVERDNVSSIAGAMPSKQKNAMFGNLDMPTSYPQKGKRRRSYPKTERRIGDVAFARVPTGLETCTYCMMLASRGFVYRSADSAGHADHRNCDCMIVPGRYLVSKIDGIDTDAQYECWRDLEALEAYATQHPDEIDRKELERRKKEIVSGYSNITLSTEPSEIRKHASEGVMAWYEPRARMAASYKG